jgi:hypothetical protein
MVRSDEWSIVWGFFQKNYYKRAFFLIKKVCQNSFMAKLSIHVTGVL